MQIIPVNLDSVLLLLHNSKLACCAREGTNQWDGIFGFFRNSGISEPLHEVTTPQTSSFFPGIFPFQLIHYSFSSKFLIEWKGARDNRSGTNSNTTGRVARASYNNVDLHSSRLHLGKQTSKRRGSPLHEKPKPDFEKVDPLPCTPKFRLEDRFK